MRTYQDESRRMLGLDFVTEITFLLDSHHTGIIG